MPARVLLAAALACAPAFAQSKKKPAAAQPPAAAPQKQDEEYTKLIKEYLQDPRITTELVDHMPASDTVPSPLKFFGRIPGKPGELTYAKDIERYYEALAKASPRAKFWKIGTDRRGPRPGDPGHRRRSHHQAIWTSTRTCSPSSAIRARSPRTQAQRAHPYRQAHLLGHQRHSFARNRRPRNAHRAGLPPDRRRDALHPDHPQQRHHLYHAGDRSGWPREAWSTPITTTRSCRRAPNACR